MDQTLVDVVLPNHVLRIVPLLLLTPLRVELVNLASHLPQFSEIIGLWYKEMSNRAGETGRRVELTL